MRGLENHKCALWKLDNENKGSFNGKYKIDHIIEFCIFRDDNIKNLQALCISYYTNNFLNHLLIMQLANKNTKNNEYCIIVDKFEKYRKYLFRLS
jgi:hypothetical protein